MSIRNVVLNAFPDTNANTAFVVPQMQFGVVTSDFTLTNGTSQQVVFPTNIDALTLNSATPYFYESMIWITSGATAHSVAWDIGAGTATFTTIALIGVGNVSAAATTAATNMVEITSTSSVVVAASAGAAGNRLYISGYLLVNAGGTVIPRIAFNADPTGTLLTKAGSWFRVYPIGYLGSGAVAAVGNIA